MPDPTQLPHLLKLLDDDSETVQMAVAQALAAFGVELDRELSQLAIPPNELQLQQIRQLVDAHTEDNALEDPDDSKPHFRSGQLVKHRRYNYRGVVVDLDSSCQADDDWYLANRTQPGRDQPWYHVLVHDSNQVTYAAQTSLEEDDSQAEIAHPLVPHFFSDFGNGEYLRNDTPWPRS
jgi:heat shock protein HspQ